MCIINSNQKKKKRSSKSRRNWRKRKKNQFLKMSLLWIELNWWNDWSIFFSVVVIVVVVVVCYHHCNFFFFLRRIKKKTWIPNVYCSIWIFFFFVFSVIDKTLSLLLLLCYVMMFDHLEMLTNIYFAHAFSFFFREKKR